MRHKEGDASFAQLYSTDLAQLVLCLFTSDSVYGETALGVIDEAEVLASLLNRDDVLEAGWVCRVGTDLWWLTFVSFNSASTQLFMYDAMFIIIPCRRP
jgi:hypothetical protein